MCHVGEEQGLIGARLHAQRAVAEKIPIEAVLNNDIVGNDHGGNGIVDGATIRVYSEGPEDSPSRELARFVQRWGGRYVPSHKVRLMARPDRFGRGGDHSAYNQLGFTAVGFRESRENFTRQHDVRDTFEGISLPYLAQNARVNAASAATLALAPPPPAVLSDRGQPHDHARAFRLRREPEVERRAGRDGLPDLLARGVGSRTGSTTCCVGNVTNVVLPNMQIDDYVFGVAAVDAQGHESFVDRLRDAAASEHAGEDGGAAASRSFRGGCVLDRLDELARSPSTCVRTARRTRSPTDRGSAPGRRR